MGFYLDGYDEQANNEPRASTIVETEEQAIQRAKTTLKMWAETGLELPDLSNLSLDELKNLIASAVSSFVQGLQDEREAVTGALVRNKRVAAEYVIWADGRVSLRWRSVVPSTENWDSIEDMMKVHGHNGTQFI